MPTLRDSRPTSSHQTARLAPGRHFSPDEGVCVMELASMLAGERFTDHPKSVCRVVAALLRGYNDMADDERRQDLYRYAALAVGTNSGREVRRRRAELCVQFAERYGDPTLRRRLLWRGDVVVQAVRALRGISDPCERHELALELVDALLAVDAQPEGSRLQGRSPDRSRSSACAAS
jgi:hypothetical protein